MITVETTETGVRVTIPKGEVPPERLNTLLDWLRSGATAKEWPERYFEQTAGAFADEPLERPTQLPFEKREKW